MPSEIRTLRIERMADAIRGINPSTIGQQDVATHIAETAYEALMTPVYPDDYRWCEDCQVRGGIRCVDLDTHTPLDEAHLIRMPSWGYGLTVLAKELLGD